MGRYGGQYSYGWPVYVPVAARRRQTAATRKSLQKRGRTFQPIELTGRKIAATFWGTAWCQHLEAYSDYANRLPRGRSYVRNGSVLDLRITAGKVAALVSGSRLYQIEIRIKPLESAKWQRMIRACAGKIDSLIELLQGKISHHVMAVLTHPSTGMFPSPRQIALQCSCPDWAEMCKHVAATLYGVGARLDQQPELLFVLRGVDRADLLTAKTALTRKTPAGRKKRPSLKGQDLSRLFNIELAKDPNSQP